MENKGKGAKYERRGEPTMKLICVILLPDFTTEQIGTLSLFEGENNDNYLLKLVFSAPVGQITTQR